MHIHLSWIGAVTTFLYVIIIGTFWRIASIHWKNTALGQAMALAY
jgi:hypothetical protein